MKKITMLFLAFFLISGLAFAVPQVQITNEDGSIPVNVTVDGKLEVSAELDPVEVTAVNIKNVADQEINPAKEDGNLATLAGGVTASKYQVNVTNTSIPVTGTFYQATQPVSGTFWQATQPVSIASMPSTPVTGTFWQETQPISGTVTVNAGTNLNTSLLATEATLAKLTIAQNADLGSNTQALVGGSVTTGYPTYTTAKIQPLSLATDGTLRTQSDLNPPTGLGSGQTTVTTAGTRVALAGSQVCLSVTIKAKKTNTGLIYVGTAAAVSSSVGFILSAGDTVTVDVDNLADVGLDSSVNAEGVSYIYATK